MSAFQSTELETYLAQLHTRYQTNRWDGGATLRQLGFAQPQLIVGLLGYICQHLDQSYSSYLIEDLIAHESYSHAKMSLEIGCKHDFPSHVFGYFALEAVKDNTKSEPEQRRVVSNLYNICMAIAQYSPIDIQMMFENRRPIENLCKIFSTNKLGEGKIVDLITAYYKTNPEHFFTDNGRGFGAAQYLSPSTYQRVAAQLKAEKKLTKVFTFSSTTPFFINLLHTLVRAPSIVLQRISRDKKNSDHSTPDSRGHLTSTQMHSGRESLSLGHIVGNIYLEGLEKIYHLRDHNFDSKELVLKTLERVLEQYSQLYVRSHKSLESQSEVKFYLTYQFKNSFNNIIDNFTKVLTSQDAEIVHKGCTLLEQNLQLMSQHIEHMHSDFGPHGSEVALQELKTEKQYLKLKAGA